MSTALLLTLGVLGGLLVILGPLLIHGLWRTHRAARRVRDVERVAQGKCPRCNYSVMGQLSDACAECGYTFTAGEKRRLEGIYLGLERMRERGQQP